MKAAIFNLTLTCCLLLMLCEGCMHKDASFKGADISVTNTYIESGVKDLSGSSLKVFCLAPPGMCPGHFDMSPEQLRQLRSSRLLYRFDFQAQLDEQVKRMHSRIIPIRIGQGMCIPQTYADMCRQVAASLSEEYPDKQAEYAERLAVLEARLGRLSDEILSRIEQKGLKGSKVISSRHQADFMRWMGLDVIATFQGADSMTPAEIEHCLNAGREQQVRLVIANQQEGTELPGRFAQELNGTLVVFSNFPDGEGGPEPSFDRLVLSNIDHLINQLP